MASLRLGDTALLDGENFDLAVTRQDDITRGSAHQSPRHGGDVRNRSIPRIRFVFPDDPERLAPAVVPPECHPMPEGDRAEIRRRRNKLSRPDTVGEISHVARGDRDGATTFAGVDPLRGVIGSATLRHHIGQRLQSRRGHQIRMRRDRPIRRHCQTNFSGRLWLW